MKKFLVLLLILLVGCSAVEEIKDTEVPKVEDKPLIEEKPIIKEEPIKKPEEKPTEKPVDKPVDKPTVIPDKKYYVSNPASITVLINKQRYLPKDYVPKLKDITGKYASRAGMKARPEAADAFVAMWDDLYEETGLEMQVMSSYRTYKYQQDNYDRYLKRHGKKEADRTIAPAGASEHNAGLALDLQPKGGNMDTFGASEQGKWVKLNAHKYGFVIRYEGKYESITGFLDEPWHIRYLGVDIATQVYESGKPLELFKNLPQ